MTPEEKFNKDVWYVLTRIKEKSLYTKKNNPIDYWVDFSPAYAPNAPSAADEEAILGKLEEWGAITVEVRGWDYM